MVCRHLAFWLLVRVVSEPLPHWGSGGTEGILGYPVPREPCLRLGLAKRAQPLAPPHSGLSPRRLLPRRLPGGDPGTHMV